jgi:hypothetical protein
MDFLDAIKLNLFATEIFVFTPKGEIKTMPSGCTVLDFAFSIHTFLGSHCIGAKVNHKLVPLSYKLKSGDQIEILTSKSHHVQPSWINFVSTAKAKAKIEAILRRTYREIQKKGEEKLNDWLEKNGFTVNACIGMGTSLDEVRRLNRADVSIVVSSAGRPLAETLKQRYGIPYIVGVPYGKCFAAFLAEELRTAAGKKGTPGVVVTDVAGKYRSFDSRSAVVGESVLATSLAAAISVCTGQGTRVLDTVGDGDMSQLSESDISCDDEERLEEELKASEIEIADPLFRPICGDGEFIRLPHDAFSGRCYKSEEINMIDTDVPFFNRLKEFG